MFLVSMASAVLFAGLGCNDGELLAFQDGNPLNPDADDDDDDDREGGDDDDSGGPWDDPGDDDDAGVEGDPDPWLDECPPEAMRPSDFEGGAGDQAYVKSWERTQDEGTFTVDATAYYAVYNTEVYESGGSQPNETAYFRFPGDLAGDGASQVRNCGDEWIVQDSDNSGASPGALIFVGVFLLEEGRNTVHMHHFCPLYRDGACGDFHLGDPGSDGGCMDDNPNSVHFKAEGLCLVPWSP